MKFLILIVLLILNNISYGAEGEATSSRIRERYNKLVFKGEPLDNGEVEELFSLYKSKGYEYFGHRLQLKGAVKLRTYGNDEVYEFAAIELARIARMGRHRDDQAEARALLWDSLDLRDTRGLLMLIGDHDEYIHQDLESGDRRRYARGSKILEIKLTEEDPISSMSTARRYLRHPDFRDLCLNCFSRTPKVEFVDYSRFHRIGWGDFPDFRFERIADKPLLNELYNNLKGTPYLGVFLRNLREGLDLWDFPIFERPGIKYKPSEAVSSGRFLIDLSGVEEEPLYALGLSKYREKGDIDNYTRERHLAPYLNLDILLEMGLANSSLRVRRVAIILVSKFIRKTGHTYNFPLLFSLEDPRLDESRNTVLKLNPSNIASAISDKKFLNRRLVYRAVNSLFDEGELYGERGFQAIGAFFVYYFNNRGEDLDKEEEELRNLVLVDMQERLVALSIEWDFNNDSRFIDSFLWQQRWFGEQVSKISNASDIRSNLWKQKYAKKLTRGITFVRDGIDVYTDAYPRTVRVVKDLYATGKAALTGYELAVACGGPQALTPACWVTVGAVGLEAIDSRFGVSAGIQTLGSHALRTFGVDAMDADYIVTAGGDLVEVVPSISKFDRPALLFDFRSLY